MAHPKQQEIYDSEVFITCQPGRSEEEPSELQPLMASSGQQSLSCSADLLEFCPPGLEVLTSLDFLSVVQKVEMLEAVMDVEQQNRYNILDGQGHKLYRAVEQSTSFSLMCQGPDRRYNIALLDWTGKEIMRMRRYFSNCCCSCTSYIAVTNTDESKRYGVVRSYTNGFGCTNKLLVHDAEGQPVFRVSTNVEGWGVNPRFMIYGADDAVVGSIKKNWGGLAKELLTDANTFAITFPLDIDQKLKACLIAAVFFLDFLYFEDRR